MSVPATVPIPGPRATRPVCTGSSTPRACCPQAAQRLDTRRELWPDEVRIRVETLNLDAASFRQLETKHAGDGDAVRREVLEIVATRGKMQNPVTGSGGMLIGTVEEVGPESTLGLAVGDRVATLVSLTLTPLVIEDGLERWDGPREQVPADGYAILFGRSIAARSPTTCRRRWPLGDGRLRRTRAHPPGRGAVRAARRRRHRRRRQVRLAEPAAAAANAGARRTVGVVPNDAEADAAARQRARRRRRRRRRPRPDRPARRGRRHRRPRPTSPSSASTCPAARAARSWPPPSAAPSSSSRWRRRSPPPRSAPRAWRPTSRCWSATATRRATRPTPSTCCGQRRRTPLFERRL